MGHDQNHGGRRDNRALLADVRDLSDEELADLLVALDPKVYQELLERALGQQPRRRPPRVKPAAGHSASCDPTGKERAGQGECVQSGCLSAYARS